MGLMLAYSRKNGNAYDTWLRGVWAICHVCKGFGWDADNVAIAWSKQLPKFGGEKSVRDKVREHKKDKGTYNLQWLLNQVDEEARQTFAEFERNYCYYDYTWLFSNYSCKHNAALVKIEDVEKYVKTAFVRIDRMANVLTYMRDCNGSTLAYPSKTIV